MMKKLSIAPKITLGNIIEKETIDEVNFSDHATSQTSNAGIDGQGRCENRRGTEIDNERYA